MKRIIYFFSFLGLMACKHSPQVTEWRGENRSGFYQETNLLKSWPKNGPDILWETESIGNGYSSPIVTDQFVYATGEIDSLGYLFKFDNQGNKLWETNYGKEWTTNFPGSRGTPTLVDNLIYVCSGLGKISCISAESGELIWGKDMLSEFKGVSPKFGFSQSPLISGNLVFHQPGGEKMNVVALDRNTGEVVWSETYFGEHPGYNSAKLIKWNGNKILAVFSAYHLLGIEPATGKLLWAHEQTNTKPEERGPGKGDTHGNTILFDNGFIYYSAADGNGGVKLALNEDGTSITEVWKTPDFDNFMGGIIKVNDKLYTGSHRKHQLIAINTETAEKTDSLDLGRGITIFSDNMIYFYADKGTLFLVDPSNRLKEVSSFKINKGTKEHFAHPVIDNGKLYIRHGKYLGVYNIKQHS